MTPGDVVEHNELLSLLESDNLGLLYRSVARADKQLRKTQHRALAVVPRKGYRLLHASEHVTRAESHKGKATRQMNTAVSVMRATDLAQLDPTARVFAMKVTIGMMLLAQTLDAQAATLARHETLIDDLRQRVEGLEQPNL